MAENQQAYDLRSAIEDDAEVLSLLQAETFRQAYSDVHSKENIAAYITENFVSDACRIDLASSKTQCCLAFKDKDPVGYVLLSQTSHSQLKDARSAIELKQIYIVASEYGAGLGRVLFNAALEIAIGQSHDVLWLAVSDKNLRARRFYEKLGFQVCGKGPIFHVGTDRLTSTILSIDLFR